VKLCAEQQSEENWIESRGKRMRAPKRKRLQVESEEKEGRRNV
jgi:hypothetical protein